jgi:predicted metal-binding protein
MVTSGLPAPETFVRRACVLGASDARVVSPKEVFTAEWVRLKCQFGCGGFGEHLTCPPFAPTPGVMRRVLDEYEVGVLVHSGSSEWRELSPLIASLEREAFLAGYYKALGLGSGPCDLCASCDVKGGCQHPEVARPSMEACGIDVYRTARAAGFEIEVVRDYSCRQNYFALLLLL